MHSGVFGCGQMDQRSTTISQYADYTRASKSYDATRISVAIASVLGCLACSKVPLHEQTVLEAGCGTGNYLKVLQDRVGRLTGIDFNEDMLAHARIKVSSEVELHCGSILDLPYADQQFEGVLCNQVLHHLDAGPTSTDDPLLWAGTSFENVARFFDEAYRTLRPGGVLVINISTHAQVRDGYWWSELIPTAIARMLHRSPDLPTLQGLMMAAGFCVESVVADLHGILQGNCYLNPLGPLSDEWRAGDSTWTLASAAELAEACERVEQMDGEGTMEGFLAERERRRKLVGQSTVVCGRK